jgi:hypothetical protein
MKKITCVLVILAAASTAAVAKDLKQDKKATTDAPAVSATQMSDSEMDKVTAGEQGGLGNGWGEGRGIGFDNVGGGRGQGYLNSNCNSAVQASC